MIDSRYQVFLAVVGLLIGLFTNVGQATAGYIPASTNGARIVVEREYADSVVEEVFGLVIGDVTESADSFAYRVTGFSDSRKCPLHGIRDLNCDDFDWVPSAVRIYKDAWDGPVSGHLSRNRVVMVDLESDSVGFAIGTMQGLLVTPSAGMTRRNAPAFGWYLTRSGRSLSMSVRDVSGDGIPDVVYTYSQMLPRGVVLVVQDVWTFVEMAAAKHISSGEKLSGVLSSTFEGVPVFLSSEGRIERGRFVYRPVQGSASGSGAPSSVVVVERSVSQGSGVYPTWEFQVLADLGGGWTDFLAVQGGAGGPDNNGTADRGAAGTDDQLDDADLDPPEGDRCTLAEVPVDAPVSVRRMFLDLEEVCRIADGATAFKSVPVRIGSLLLKAFGLAGRGYPVLASTFFESAAIELDAVGFRRSAMVFSAAAAMGVSAAVDAACGNAAGHQCDDVGFTSTDGLVSGRAILIADELATMFHSAWNLLTGGLVVPAATDP